MKRKTGLRMWWGGRRSRRGRGKRRRRGGGRGEGEEEVGKEDEKERRRKRRRRRRRRRRKNIIHILSPFLIMEICRSVVDVRFLSRLGQACRL